MRPVHQAPLLVQRLDVAILALQRLDKALEDAVVVKQDKSRLVVDLDSNDRGMVGVSTEDCSNHALCVEPERCVGEVDLLTSSPPDPLTSQSLCGELRIAAGEPHRDGVGGCPEDDRNATAVRTIKNRLEPIELEPAVRTACARVIVGGALSGPSCNAARPRRDCAPRACAGCCSRASRRCAAR